MEIVCGNYALNYLNIEFPSVFQKVGYYRVNFYSEYFSESIFIYSSTNDESLTLKVDTKVSSVRLYISSLNLDKQEFLTINLEKPKLELLKLLNSLLKT